jgi:hypothetical protein
VPTSPPGPSSLTTPKGTPVFVRHSSNLQQDANLAGICEPVAYAKLPADEQEAYKKC